MKAKARVYLVRNGPGPGTSGPGKEMQLEDLYKVPNLNPRYLGPELPAFNVEFPSEYPQHVVVEVNPSGTDDNKFPHAGFYVLPDISPDDFQRIFNQAW